MIQGKLVNACKKDRGTLILQCGLTIHIYRENTRKTRKTLMDTSEASEGVAEKKEKERSSVKFVKIK